MTRARDVANVLSTATTLATDTETAAAISSHNSANDPHTGYVLESLYDAKGDLIVGSADNTPSKLTSGNNGETLVADSSTSTGLRYQTGNGLAQGTINGGFDVWQRGTSFNAVSYGADRWFNGSANTTYSRESTAANLPTGFQYGIKMTMTGTDAPYAMQAVETANAIYYAGKRVVMSYYVSSTLSSNAHVRLDASTGTDTGITGVYTQISPVSGHSASAATTTSMTRVYSVYDVPSNCRTLRIIIGSISSITSGNSMTITGVQLEVGQVPTTFRRAGGTIQGELGACQRYYWQWAGGVNGQAIGMGSAYSASQVETNVQFPVEMRTTPSLVSTTGTDYYTFQRNGGSDGFNSWTPNLNNNKTTNMYNNTNISGTAGQAGTLFTNNTLAQIAFSAEL